jgi:hypothetical protein
MPINLIIVGVNTVGSLEQKIVVYSRLLSVIVYIS